MPGQPGFAELERRLAKAGDEIFQLIADGRSMREVAAHFGSSRTQLYRWSAAVEDRRAALARARRHAAVSHIDDALAALDAATTPAEAQIAREQAAMRRWLAERWDRETFGTQSDGASFSIQQLHLNCLMRFAADNARKRQVAEVRALPPSDGVEHAPRSPGD